MPLRLLKPHCLSEDLCWTSLGTLCCCLPFSFRTSFGYLLFLLYCQYLFWEERFFIAIATGLCLLLEMAWPDWWGPDFNEGWWHCYQLECCLIHYSMQREKMGWSSLPESSSHELGMHPRSESMLHSRLDHYLEHSSWVVNVVIEEKQ